MPSSYSLKVIERTAPDAASASERFTRALVELTRAVWHDECTFESAIDAICEIAAHALQVERVSVWQYDSSARLLRCLQAHSPMRGAGRLSEDLDTLALEGEDYMAALQQVRALDVSDVEIGASDATGLSPLRDYLQKHHIHARLDAPACVSGELLGVICHESVERSRSWTQDEVTFAASMGDNVAMAYQIARRREAEDEVRHLRLHDATTGLANRDYLLESIAQRLAAPAETGEVLAVVHLRIDSSGGIALPADAPTVDEVMALIAQCVSRLVGDDIDLARARTDGLAFLLARKATDRSAIRLA